MIKTTLQCSDDQAQFSERLTVISEKNAPNDFTGQTKVPVYKNPFNFTFTF